MKKNSINLSLVAVTLIALAAVTRFLPHPANFTAIGAIALFGTARMNDKRIGFLLPIAAMLISDLFLPGGFNLSVYVAFAVISLLGLSLRKSNKALPVFGASIASSVIFYIITNWAMWYFGNGAFYPETINGLWLSYTAAIPFFLNGLAGDLFFNAALFGTYAIASKQLAFAK